MTAGGASTPASALQSLIYTPASSNVPTLAVLDQLLIPREKAYIDVKTVQDAWQVIRDMNVRGAPLIAIVAVLGLGCDMSARAAAGGYGTLGQADQWLREAADYLRTSRPTAVNLFTAMDQIVALGGKVVAEQGGPEGKDAKALVQAVVSFAEELLRMDVETNQAIGDHGAAAILSNAPGRAVRVMTHCNTGSLATAGYGTALGVIRSLQAAGRLERVYCTETRPYNQGARLTAFELVQDKLPGTLVTDSMASFLMGTKGLDAVVVGADRIAGNGDTANKIGTYQLAVACKHHGVAFYVAAPFTSFDLTLFSGKQIVIEERPAQELTHVQGQQVAPQGIAVWNPGFDVTPAALITGGIITERGVILPSVRGEEGEVFFDVAGFLQGEGAHRPEVEAGLECSVAPPPLEYEAMEATRLARFLRCHVPQVWAMLGAKSGEELVITEVGDGNLNLVFIVQGPRDTVVVKQALPYVRCVGESWPLTLDRAYYENAALVQEYELTPRLVPEVFYFSKTLALIVMRYIAPPHLILRKALIRGQLLPTLSADLAEFMARNLFFTSSLHLTGPEKRAQVAFWSGNHGLCALTEAVVFTEPYVASVAHNRWTSPQLDGEVQALRADVELKLAVGRLKAKYMDATEALLHGDLHTGSVMVKEGSTFVIDPEFGFYGPMGFEVGALLANFLLAFFAQAGHGNGASYADWVLEQVVAIWEGFQQRFLALWDDEGAHKGELFKREAYAGAGERVASQQAFFRQLLADTLGFAGCKMIRRVIGIAHVEDLESIADADVRAACEKRALRMARELVVHADKYSSIRDVAALAGKAGQ